MGIRFEDTEGNMRLLNANNFFTPLTPEENQLKHVTRAVRDSQEWKDRDRSYQIKPEEVARRVLEVFPEVEYRREGDVKIFVQNKRQRDDAVYMFVADELSRHAAVESVAGSAQDVDIAGEAHEKIKRMSRERELCKDLPSLVIPESWESLLADEEATPNNGHTVAVLRFSRHPEALRSALLQSEFAAEAQAGVPDIEPGWAKGAKIFVPVSAEDVPADLELRPYHVLVWEEHIPRITEVLGTIPCRQRPSIKSSQTFALERQESTANKADGISGYVVERTFIHMPEPRIFTPRSDYTRSYDDAVPGHTNPRSKMQAVDSCPDSTSSCNSVAQCGLSMQTYWAEMKDCHRHRDRDRATICYSNMLRENLVPNVHIFTILIDLFGKTGAHHEAERWMHVMRGCGVSPSCVTFNCLINAYAKAGIGSGAEKWFQEMVEADMKPSLSTYNCMIRAFALQGCVEQAEAWIEEAKSNFHVWEATTFKVTMELYAHKGLPQKVESCFFEMQRIGLPLPREAYRAVISAHAAHRDLDKARAWVNKAGESGFAPLVDEYTELLRACAPKHDGPSAYSSEGRSVFLEQVAKGIAPNRNNMEALDDALGKASARRLCSQLHLHTRAARLDWWQDPRNFSKPTRLARQILEEEL